MNTVVPPAQPGRPAVTPMAFVRAMLLAYRKYGQDPSEALRRAHIATAAIEKPNARITAWQMETLSGVAMQQLDDEALGWFSRRLPWGSYGMLCRASITSPTLGVALKRWCRHHRLLTEDIVLSLSERDGEVRLAIDERIALGAMREFCLVTCLRFVHGFACWAVDSSIALREAGFPFPAPEHADAYPRMFPGTIRFGAEAAGFTLAAAYLALPLRRDEQALRTMLQRALPLTVLQYRRDRLLVQRVRELLRSPAGGPVNAESLAAALHVSARTLHRHLHEEGATLQALKDEVRRERAMELLSRTSRPVKQVAQAAGFASEKSFARAFREWSGLSPSEWRRRGVS